MYLIVLIALMLNLRELGYLDDKKLCVMLVLSMVFDLEGAPNCRLRQKRIKSSIGLIKEGHIGICPLLK